MSARGLLRIALLTSFGACFFLGLAGPVLAQPRGSHALLLEVDGIINPVKERLISRTLQQAELDQATLVIIQLDTPGGLLSSTRAIVEDLLSAGVPVAVYVAPSGARAGSAGTFIAAAGNFAVMAPGTNIGAATPVGPGGQDLDETIGSKVTNDAAALIRSIAQVRGRNEEKLEETVRSAASFSAREAVDLNVVDFIADDIRDLLSQLDGRELEVRSVARTLETRGLPYRQVKKSLLEHFLEFISDPNVSFILLTIGGLGVVIELFNPGLVAPGVVGVIALLLAFLALGNLPVNWAGVAFILLAVALAALETQVAGFGILGVGAVVCFVAGGLLLFAQFGGGSPTLPSISVNRWLLVGITAGLSMTLILALRLIYRSGQGEETADDSSPVGELGRVTTDLAPQGVVRLGAETWTAVSEDGNVIPAGERIKVTKVEGLILTVSRHEEAHR